MVNRTLVLSISILVLAVACGDGQAPDSIWRADGAAGPRVRFDLFADQLPEVPLPNDVATWPDPTSITGRRVNASKVAPTGMERRARSRFDELTGWGTYTAISVQFDAPIDVPALVDTFRDARGRSDFDFADDAVYVVDLENGVPTPLDVCDGNFPLVHEDPNRFYANDPRGTTSNIIFETAEEDLNQNGALDPGEDTDYDGVLDHPNVIDWNGDGTLDADRELATCYEFETNTLLVRPLIPLREEHEYAVVLTRRLRGLDGAPTQPPASFPFRHHVEQTDRMDILSDRIMERPNLYGALRMDPAHPADTEVAFAWTFTTQTTTRELRDAREGLYGRGPFAELENAVENEVRLLEAVGEGPGTQEENCPADRSNPYVVKVEQIIEVLRDRGPEVFDVSPEVMNRLMDSFRFIDHIAVAQYQTPFLVAQDKWHDTVESAWHVNSRTGDVGTIGMDTVNVWIVVPKPLAEGYEQPYPVALYGHGYTGPALEVLGFAGNLAKFGIASIGVQSVGHGMGMDALTEDLATALFDVGCAYPLGQNVFGRDDDPSFEPDRSRDLNNDGMKDSGREFWTGYTFHTRDVVRQTVLDWMQLVRILRSYDGREGPQDLDDDGANDIAGDFDLDGTPDIGGDVDYYAWGQSLGGIESMIAGSAEPAFTAATPVAGSAGLVDVGVRSTQGGVKEAVILRVMGPLVLGFPPSVDADGDGTLDRREDLNGDGEIGEGERDFDGDDNADVQEGPYPPPADREDPEDEPECVDMDNDENTYEVSRCPVGQSSLRFIVPDLNSTADIEFGCTENLSPGNVVVIHNPNGEVRCAEVSRDDPATEGVDESGRLRIGMPADIGDVLVIDIYEPGAVPDFGSCRLADDATHVESISSFGVKGCFYGEMFFPGDALVSLAEGLGLRRGTPNIRRFLMLAQLALEPGDPVSWARAYNLEPPEYDDPEEGPTNLMDIGTIGDMNVPINTSVAFGRAAGLVPFIASTSTWDPEHPDSLGPDAFPEELAAYLSTSEFEDIYDGRTQNQLLLDTFVTEGLERLERYPSETPPGTLFDIDDYDEDTDDYEAPRLMDQGRPPLRLNRDTVPGDPRVGRSAQIFPYIDADGEHGFYLSNLENEFDIDLYCINLIGRYYQSGGTDILFESDPDGHTCLEDDTCEFIPDVPTD